MVYVLKAYLIKRLDYNRKSELCTIIVQLICTPCLNFEMLSCAFFILALYGVYYLKSRNGFLTLSSSSSILIYFKLGSSKLYWNESHFEVLISIGY